MKLAIAIASCVVLLSGPAHAQFDRPVAALQISPDGVYRAGFMYWYGPDGLFLHPAEFVLLGTVKHVDLRQDDRNSLAQTFWDGELNAIRVVRCPDSLASQAAEIRTLTCSGGFRELAVGDTVVAFLIRYEGQYAVPNWGRTNSSLGYKFTSGINNELSELEQFLELLSQPTAWDAASLTADQLRLWAWVDPYGVAEALIRVREWSERNPGVHE